MANPSSTILAQSISWNSNTWNADTGGALRVRWRRLLNIVKDLTGADVYSRQAFGVGGAVEVRVALRDAPIITLMAKSNMAVTYKTKGGTKVRNFAGMVYIGTEASQDKDNLGEEECVFVDESADGITDPVS